MNLPRSLRVVCDAAREAQVYWAEFRDCLMSHESDEESRYPPILRNYAAVVDCLKHAKAGQELLSEVGDEFAAISEGPAFVVAGTSYLGLSWHEVVLKKLVGVSFNVLEEYFCARASEHLGLDPDACWWQLSESQSSTWHEMRASFSKQPFDETEFGIWIRATLNRTGEILLRDQNYQLAVRESCREDAILSGHEEVNIRLDIEAARVGVQRRYADRKHPADLENVPTEIDFEQLDFNRTERAIIEVLLRANRRLTTKLVLDALAKAGIVLSDSTIKNCLAYMHKNKVLHNDPKARPKGYYVNLDSPAFRPRSIP